MTATIPAVTDPDQQHGLLTLAEIESAALKLNDSEKSELVTLLGGVIEPSAEIEPDEEEQQWRAEIQRRVDDIRQGRVVGRDGETVIREALARFS